MKFAAVLSCSLLLTTTASLVTDYDALGFLSPTSKYNASSAQHFAYQTT